MSWSLGTYTRFGGATKWGDDRDASVEIEAGIHDSHDEDLAAGINACLTKDGSNAATGDLNLGTNKITNVADPTNAQDAATKAYVDTSASIVYASGDQLIWRSTVNPYTLPTGWTRVAQNDKALRIMSSSGALSSGGSTAFSSVFGAAGGGHALTLAEMPGHLHGAPSGTTGYYCQPAPTTGPVAGSGPAFYSPSVQQYTGQVTAGKTYGSNGDSHTHVTPAIMYYEMNIIQKT